MEHPRNDKNKTQGWFRLTTTMTYLTDMISKLIIGHWISPCFNTKNVLFLCHSHILIKLCDIERRKNRSLKFCYVPITSAAHNRLLFFFWLQPFTVLMKQTRAVKQSIFLDVYGLYRHNIQKIQVNFKVHTKKLI